MILGAGRLVKIGKNPRSEKSSVIFEMLANKKKEFEGSPEELLQGFFNNYTGREVTTEDHLAIFGCDQREEEKKK